MKCQILTYNTHGLPWSRDSTPEICGWIKDTKPRILCFQEVFRKTTRAQYKEFLERHGYSVIIPNDSGVTMLSSGLLTAFLTKQYALRSQCFCSFQDFNNVEILSNKGFHILRLYDKTVGRPLIIGNTHTQSDTEISWMSGTKVPKTRKKQFKQIVDFLGCTTDPVLVAGDFNCEVSPYPALRFLHPLHDDLIRKSTFYPTGENLDHVAWIPLQWANPGCGLCDVERHGPILESCVIHNKSWSDHAPVVFNIRMPPVRKTDVKQ
jgi:exonuclease III